jgi:hypothetical protein
MPTIGEFRKLAIQREWTEDYLVDICKSEIDSPRRIVQEILAGQGRQNPKFGGMGKMMDMRDTELVWAPLCDLYFRALQPTIGTSTKTKFCACGCGQTVRSNRKWAGPRCRQKAWRRNAKSIA